MRKKRILIVDDQRDVAMLLHHQLDLQDCEIEEIYSGSQALKQIFKGGYDLVLLDFDMKDIKGDRICLMLRSDDNFNALPIIIITAHVELDERVFREYGANKVLYKPVESDDLIAAVKECLK